MTLDFNVFEQTIEQLPSESIPRNGSRKYLNLRFNLGKDWENLTATAYLQHGDRSTPIIVSDGEEVAVPDYYAAQNSFMLMLIGIGSGGVEIPTNILCITLGDAGTGWTSIPADPETPAYAQLVAIAEDARASAEAAARSAQEAANAKSAYQIAVANVPAGPDDAYTATGDLLPVVSVGNSQAQIEAVGKGLQIVFIPMVANKTKSPTLRLNGGEAIPIRMRWYTNKGTNENAPEATTNVEVGSLMRGVPYTLTFCGKYWLVDSQITSPSFDNLTRDKLQSVANGFIGASGTNKFAVPINKRNGVIGNAMISTTDAEKESNSINLVSEGKASEMIRKDVTAEWETFRSAGADAGRIPLEHEFAVTLGEGRYFFEGDMFKAYATVVEESFSPEGSKLTFLTTLYDDELHYLQIFADGTRIFEAELDTGGKRSSATMYPSGKPESVITSGKYPTPTVSDNGKSLRVVDGKAKWEGALSGTTDELTPTQVYEAVKAGRPVVVTYHNQFFGELKYTSFTISEMANSIAANTIGYSSGLYVLGYLLGNKSSNNWDFFLTSLAETDNIPDYLPNPNPLTIKAGDTTVTYNGSTEETVDVVEAVGFPQPAASDNGKYLGCENGKAAWLPVEALGGGSAEDIWELIDTIPLVKDTVLYEIASFTDYKKIAIASTGKVIPSQSIGNNWLRLVDPSGFSIRQVLLDGLYSSIEYCAAILWEGNLLKHFQYHTSNTNTLKQRGEAYKIYDGDFTGTTMQIILSKENAAIVNTDTSFNVYGVRR